MSTHHVLPAALQPETRRLITRRELVARAPGVRQRGSFTSGELICILLYIFPVNSSYHSDGQDIRAKSSPTKLTDSCP